MSLPTQADLHRLFEYSREDNTLIHKRNKKKRDIWNEHYAGKKINPQYENGIAYLMVMNSLYRVSDLIDVWLGISYDLKGVSPQEWYKNYQRRMKAINQMSLSELKEFQRQTINGDYTLLNKKISDVKSKERSPFFHINKVSRNSFTVELYKDGQHYFRKYPTQEEAIDFVNKHTKGF